ncbi:MAG: MFS transporter [Gammaproteobacteria bacterium]|nr:MFS transporter [Gammaproteobacteria bacterium]
MRNLFAFTRYEWLVILAGWAGWGFDVFDALLFNFVAPSCIPALLHLAPGSPAARSAAAFWTGTITSVLLVSWAAGGVLFGLLADRIGRKRALFLTITLFALGTGLCAAVASLPQLIACRVLASLGIGGEWGIGATLIAETVAEARRVPAGVLMQSASPLGVMLAAAINYLVAGVWFAADPLHAWRYVFLAGLAPLPLALLVRVFLRESAPWEASRAARPAPRLRALFTPQLRRATLSGTFVAVVGVLTWWACNAFVPLLGATLAAEEAAHRMLSAPATTLLIAAWQSQGSNAFNLGGLVGMLAAIPLSLWYGRRRLFVGYFCTSALAIGCTFGLPLPPQARLWALGLVGAGAFGLFGALTYYLPELFPARLRATGAGFCYNIGRVFAAAGPFVVGVVSARSSGSSSALCAILVWVALVPLAAALVTPRITLETRGRPLPA